MSTASPLPGASAPRMPTIRLLGHEPEPGTPRLALVPAPVPPPPPPRGPAPDDERLRRHVAGVLRLVLEVVDGRRPAAQLTRHLAPRARRYAVAASGRSDLRAPVSTPSTGSATAARLASVRLGRPAPGVAEAAAVCRFGERVRAVAARFERHDGRWWCVELRVG